MGPRARARRRCSSARPRCPGYRGSRSLAFEEFDPFWKRVVEADILVSMHASDSGYSRYQSDWTGPMEMLPFRLDPFRLMTVKERPIFDTMAALTCHGLLTRFPDLRIALDRERRRLGARASSSTSSDVLPEDAAGVRRGPGRGVQAQRLRRARSTRTTSAS